MDARHTAGLTQDQLAKRLGRPQSFVAKYESRERRLDVIEFLSLSKALEFDPYEAIHIIEEYIK
ncbi:helix-turn-helix transcriptional regulator [Azospirillum sp. A26]|uniref:helix-turn-helix domain-containing protein n=1 Tax=Azospirillum sp. A26 TaxID=3160607 RepID=UPI003672723F